MKRKKKEKNKQKGTEKEKNVSLQPLLYEPPQVGATPPTLTDKEGGAQGAVVLEPAEIPAEWGVSLRDGLKPQSMYWVCGSDSEGGAAAASAAPARPAAGTGPRWRAC